MPEEAKLERTEHGLVPANEGWFVLNAADAAWKSHADFGEFCQFEGQARFAEIGVNIHVLAPGQPSCHYHRESVQENFLVLSGECLLLIDGEERRLKAWDFVHCPPGTDHVFVGAGDGPSAVLMIGARGDVDLFYPKSELAQKYDASAEEETSDPRVSYARRGSSAPVAAPWPPSDG